MSKVFVSYRRTDTQMAAGRLRESLSKRFGGDAVFRDKDTIAGGEDWINAIGENLKQDAVVLALIGPAWLNARNEAGKRRLDDAEDWNRVELERALASKCTVVPVLVDTSEMPAASDLPESLKPLARMNAVKLRDDDWEADVERLSRVLTAHGVVAKGAQPVAAARSPWRSTLMAALATLLVAAVAFAVSLYKPSDASVKSLSGSWAITHINEDGVPRAGILTLQQTGETLTGTVAWGPRAVTHEISRAVVKGSTVEFEAIGPRGAKRVYRGELDAGGDTIKGDAKGGSAEQASWSAVRQTSTAQNR